MSVKRKGPRQKPFTNSFPLSLLSGSPSTSFGSANMRCSCTTLSFNARTIPFPRQRASLRTFVRKQGDSGSCSLRSARVPPWGRQGYLEKTWARQELAWGVLPDYTRITGAVRRHVLYRKRFLQLIMMPSKLVRLFWKEWFLPFFRNAGRKEWRCRNGVFFLHLFFFLFSSKIAAPVSSLSFASCHQTYIDFSLFWPFALPWFLSISFPVLNLLFSNITLLLYVSLTQSERLSLGEISRGNAFLSFMVCKKPLYYALSWRSSNWKLVFSYYKGRGRYWSRAFWLATSNEWTILYRCMLVSHSKVGIFMAGWICRCREREWEAIWLYLSFIWF